MTGKQNSFNKMNNTRLIFKSGTNSMEQILLYYKKGQRLNLKDKNRDRNHSRPKGPNMHQPIRTRSIIAVTRVE